MDVDDKVEVIDYEGPKYIGKVGIIIEETRGCYDFEVKFENGDSEFFHEDELILVDKQEEDFSEKATDKQVGGSWYKRYVIQPIEFIFANGDELHGNDAMTINNVLKYLMRHRFKNGAEDLKKAKHYIDLLGEHEYSDEWSNEG